MINRIESIEDNNSEWQDMFKKPSNPVTLYRGVPRSSHLAYMAKFKEILGEKIDNR